MCFWRVVLDEGHMIRNRNTGGEPYSTYAWLGDYSTPVARRQSLPCPLGRPAVGLDRHAYPGKHGGFLGSAACNLDVIEPLGRRFFSHQVSTSGALLLLLVLEGQH